MNDLLETPVKKNKSKENIIDFFDRKTLHSLLYVFLGTLIYSCSVAWFLNAGEFFAGGITGISQLISYAVFKEINPYLGLMIGVLNLPLFLIGWRGVSKKFAVLTLFSVILQSVLIALFQKLVQMGFNPLEQIVRYTDPITGAFVRDATGSYIFDNGGRLLVAILGGGIAGFGSSLCLKAGGSTGGMDIIANLLLVKRNISFTRYSFTVDIIIIGISFLRSVETALFTIVRLVISTLTIDHFYTIYKMVKLEIITEKTEEIRISLLEKFHHGLTIYTVTGGYTLKEKKVIEIFVSSYEVNDYLSLINKIDPKAFTTVSALNTIKGNYIKKTIV